RLRMLHQLLDQFRFAYPAVEVAAVTSDEVAVANDAIRCSPQVPGVAEPFTLTWPWVWRALSFPWVRRLRFHANCKREELV
ncbi:MAG: hypothetical protein ACK41R_04080, partial [Thermus sp.]